MKKIKVTNNVYAEFERIWIDNRDYRKRFKNDSELLKHLIDIVSGEGFY